MDIFIKIQTYISPAYVSMFFATPRPEMNSGVKPQGLVNIVGCEAAELPRLPESIDVIVGNRICLMR